LRHHRQYKPGKVLEVGPVSARELILRGIAREVGPEQKVMVPRERKVVNETHKCRYCGKTYKTEKGYRNHKCAEAGD